MSDKNKDIQYQKNWDSNKKKAKFGLEMGEGDLSFCQLTLCFTYFQNVVMRQLEVTPERGWICQISILLMGLKHRICMVQFNFFLFFLTCKKYMTPKQYNFHSLKIPHLKAHWGHGNWGIQNSNLYVVEKEVLLYDTSITKKYNGTMSHYSGHKFPISICKLKDIWSRQTPSQYATF